MNVSNFIADFILSFVTLGSSFFNLMDSIILFAGVSLLDFSITLFIIGAILPVLITIRRRKKT